MKEQDFIAQKMPILIKEGYKKNQAYMIAKSMYGKQYAQQAINPFAQPNVNPIWSAPQPTYVKQPNTNAFGFSITAPSSNVVAPQSTPTPQAEPTAQVFQKPPMYDYTSEEINLPVNTSPSRYEETMAGAMTTPYGEQLRQGGVEATAPQTGQQKQFGNQMMYQSNIEATQPNEVNIYNPYAGVGLDQALTYAGQGFGEGDPFKAGVGTSLSLLKGARGFMSGYANGKESKRVDKQNENTLYDQNRNYIYQQQGGKLTNADALTGQFVADEGQGNVNMENDEFIKRVTGQVQQVVGEKHVVNGKEAEGIDVNLEEGDKTLSNTKILPIGAKNAKELKDRYNITVKAKDTFASVQKKVDSKIGYKKETEELASWIEKFGDNEKLKDKTTKDLNAPIIEKKMLASKAKIEALNDVRGMVFEDLYNRQEKLPKKGKPGDLFTDSGKLVTEKNEGVAQQGGYPIPALVKPNIPFSRAPYPFEQEFLDTLNNDNNNNLEQVIDYRLRNNPIPKTGDKILPIGNYLKPRGVTYARQQGGEQQDQAMQIIQAYAQASGQDPQALAEQISQMLPEEQQQALQQMAQELQSGEEQGEQEQSGQEEQEEMTAQQGGLMEMANKYGISAERAQELVSTQKGDEKEKIAPQRPIKHIQAVSTEGYRSNNRLAPGDYQKVYYVDPSQAKVENQDYEYLTDSGYDTLKRMNNYRIYMEQQKNKAAPQNNQIVDTNQQGGEKQYAQQAYTPKQQKERLSDYYTHVSGLGYTGTKDIGKMQNWMAENYPQEVTGYFTKNGQPLTAKHIDLLKEKFPSTFKAVGIDPNKASADYTNEEKLKLQNSIASADDNKIKTVYNNFLLDGFQDNKWDWRFPMVGTSLQAKGVVNPQKPQTRVVAPNMPTGEPTPTEETPQVDAQGQPIEQPTVDENGAKSYIPSFPVDLRMPPSALSALNKPYVPFGRIDPIKATSEPMLAEQERLRQADLERINQTGLSPQQMEALSASGLASSQMASNDAIGKVENFNAQNQFQTDQFNLQQRTKEDMTNAQFSQKYQDQMLGSMANTERDWRNYFTEGNLQNRMNYNDIENANLLNAKNEQYAVVPGQGVIFKNNQSQDLGLQSLTDDEWNDMTVEQQNEYKKNKLIADRKKNYLT